MKLFRLLLPVLALVASPLFAQSQVNLATQVKGVLPVANGGTSGTTGATARSGIGAAASGSNTDITTLNPSGGIQVGSPTGGAKGTGTLNAGGLYVNGSTVGTVTSIATSGLVSGGTITGTGTISLSNIGSGDVVGNSGASSAAPADTTLTAIIDRAIGSTQGQILYRGASAWSVLSPGTSGQVLQTGGASANPSWATAASGTVTVSGSPTTGNCVQWASSTAISDAGAACGSGGGGGSGALILLEQHTASSSATLNFTTAISSTYDEYDIELVNLVPATNAVTLYMRMSTNGGSSYDAGANYGYSRWIVNRFGGAQDGSDSGSSEIRINQNAAENTSTYGLSGSIRLYNPLSTSLHKVVTGNVTLLNSTFIETGVFSGRYLSTTAANAFQFLFSSGNISSGTIRVYGIAK